MFVAHVTPESSGSAGYHAMGLCDEIVLQFEPSDGSGGGRATSGSPQSWKDNRLFDLLKSYTRKTSRHVVA